MSGEGKGGGDLLARRRQRKKDERGDPNSHASRTFAAVPDSDCEQVRLG